MKPLRMYVNTVEEKEASYETLSWFKYQNWEIDLGKTKPFKDFGKGFYLSDVRSQAFEMAQFKSSLLGGKPEVSEFEFYDSELFGSTLKIKKFETYSEE